MARHSSAKVVNINLKAENRSVSLIIEDDGRGLPTNDPSAGSSLGMVGMRARTRQAGGELTVVALTQKEFGCRFKSRRRSCRMRFDRKIRILIADDHAVVRSGFRALLAAHPDLEVVGEAADGLRAVEEAVSLQPDIVVMDVTMPNLNGIEATRRITEEAPRVRVLALSMHKDAVYVREILRAGARGYLLKESGESDLINAVRALAKGEAYISPAVSDAVLSDYRKHVTDPIDLLTTREREVLQRIAEGQTNKEIATGLNLSVYTVEAHRGRVMEKLNLHSTGELVRFALRNGIID